MMPDSLKIWGTEYTGVAGFIAKDSSNNEYTYTRPSGTVNITENGVIDVAAYASASVEVEGAGTGGHVIYDPTGAIILPDDEIDLLEEDREDLTVPKDVDFIDFDGRLVYSYTAQEFLALTELPPNPSYPGLTAQGWNWTLADAKAFVQEYGAQVIGQNYKTDDGKTRLYITMPNDLFQALIDKTSNIGLYIYTCETTNTFTINWGDGVSEVKTYSGAGNRQNIPHKYAAPGDYVITIDVETGTTLRLGYQGANLGVFGSSWRYGNLVTKVEIGTGVVGLCRSAFFNASNLKSISIPTSFIDHETGREYGWFCGASFLRGIVFPQNTPGIDTLVMSGSGGNFSHIHYVSIPKTMNGFRWTSTYPRNLRKFIMPGYTTSTTLEIYLYDVESLTHFIVPGTYTTISGDRMRNSLCRKLIVPSTVTSIAAWAFVYNSYCEELHMLPESPPTMGNTNAIKDLGSAVGGGIIYVPYSEDHSILEAYQTATNWSTYASQMQEEPQP